MSYYGVEAGPWTDTYYHWLMGVPDEFVTDYNTFTTSDSQCIYNDVSTDDDATDTNSDSSSKSSLSTGALAGIIIGNNNNT
jgi:hypothetical protein